ncbi:PAS domain-containing protein [Massilia sp. B-10]|nr:PAS domain-containing protein [Massilia sp. B-10]
MPRSPTTCRWAILYVDREQHFRFANQTFLRWRNYTRDELLGKTLSQVLDERGGNVAEIAGLRAARWRVSGSCSKSNA